MQTCYATFVALHSPTLVRTAGCSPPLSARTTSQRRLNERLCKVLCIAVCFDFLHHILDAGVRPLLFLRAGLAYLAAVRGGVRAGASAGASRLASRRR